MFATLLGALPSTTDESVDLDHAIELAIRAQEEAGLEPIIDGRLRDPDFERLGAALLSEEPGRAVALAVEIWRATAALTDRAVKQALPGPYGLATSIQRPDKARAGAGRAAEARRELTLRLAMAIGETAAALAAAGCRLVEIEESDLDAIGEPAERLLFGEAHRRLIDSVSDTHLSLSIVGGAPPEALRDTIRELSYASFAVDLIAGPDSWNLVTRLPGDRGVIIGVEGARKADEPKEVLLWAAHYAASTQGRGMDRVGLGSAGSWANLTWEAAVRKMHVLGEAARLATLPPGPELSGSVDPRSVSARTAALGTTARPKPKRRG